MLRFSVLTTQAEFEEFKRGYDAQMAARSGGRIASVVKLDYLRAASRPVGCFDRSKRMVAGWVVQEDDPLIALLAMPEAEREAFASRTPRAQLCELTAIWRSDGISSDLFAALVWPKIVLDCVTRRRAHILGIGYHNTMNDIYRRLAPTLIYRGPHQILADTEVFVYDYSRATMIGTLFANLVVRKLVPGVRSIGRSTGRSIGRRG